MAMWGRMPLPPIPICPQEPWEAQEKAHRDRSRVKVAVRSRLRAISPLAHRRAHLGSTEVSSPVSASKEIHSFSRIVRKTVETRVSINAAMIPTQKSTFAIFAFE